MRIVKLVYGPVFRWAIRRVLVGRSRSPDAPEHGRFDRTDADRLLTRSWELYDQLAPGVPREAGIGPRMNVRLASATVAFQRALLESGVEPRDATALTADCAWAIYEKWARLARRISRLRSSEPSERMRMCIDGFLRFPFSQPGYRYERSQPRPGAVNIDIRRCPVADYMRAQGAGELCVGTWCNQDFALAELWGGELIRTKTLAAGDELCDFRFVAHSPATAQDRTVL
jgi:L-2-amino-thiazoline-4-carboxylic acid hydrolase